MADEEPGNAGGCEEIGIVQSIIFADKHWKQLVSCSDPSKLVLSAPECGYEENTEATCRDLDASLYSAFRASFPTLDVQYITANALKNDASKSNWMHFLCAFEGLVLDFNMISLLRVDCKLPYTQENTIIVPRTQFLCIEIARNREGYHDGIQHVQIVSDIQQQADEIRHSLQNSDPDYSRVESLLSDLNQRFPALPIKVMKNTRVGRLVASCAKKKSSSNGAELSSKMQQLRMQVAANALLQQWKVAVALQHMEQDGWEANGESLDDKEREAATYVLSQWEIGVGLPSLNHPDDDHEHEEPESTPDSEASRVALWVAKMTWAKRTLGLMARTDSFTGASSLLSRSEARAVAMFVLEGWRQGLSLPPTSMGAIGVQGAMNIGGVANSSTKQGIIENLDTIGCAHGISVCDYWFSLCVVVFQGSFKYFTAAELEVKIPQAARSSLELDDTCLTKGADLFAKTGVIFMKSVYHKEVCTILHIMVSFSESVNHIHHACMHVLPLSLSSSCSNKRCWSNASVRPHKTSAS
jgi:hypothetical protein